MEFLAGILLGSIFGFVTCVYFQNELDKDHAKGKRFTIEGKVYKAVEVKEEKDA